MYERLQDLSSEVQFGVELSRSIVRRIRNAKIYGLKETGVPVNQISRDFNYAIDRLAEDRVRETFCQLWLRGINWSYVTEDQGLVLPPGISSLTHMIDPVDGSRPAMIGAEMACFIDSIVHDNVEPVIGNLSAGVIYVFKENRIFVVEKGVGVFEVKSRDRLNRISRRINISDKLSDATAVYETYSMSNAVMGMVIDPLLRMISFKTEYPSGSYAALTLVRGQNELDIDLRRRLVQDYPNLEVMLKPSSKALFPMDVGACILMIRELGGVVTDGYGNSIDNVKLWHFRGDGSWSDENQISMVAAITPVLHARAMEKLEEGLIKLN